MERGADAQMAAKGRIWRLRALLRRAQDKWACPAHARRGRSQRGRARQRRPAEESLSPHKDHAVEISQLRPLEFV